MIKTPQNQQRMTNVALVKLKKGGKKFEIATYPNKVMAWRSGIEKDLDEVMQSEQVFVNVSRGEIAKQKDLKKCFGTDDLSTITAEILSKGQIQESEKERARAQETMFKEIATIALEKCVHADTQRPLTFGYVERIMKELHFVVKPEDSAKKQALKLIQVLQESEYPIARARMQVQVRVAQNAEAIAAVKATVEAVDKETVEGDLCTLVCRVDPACYRELDTVVKKELRGDVEVLQLAVRVDEVGELIEKAQAVRMEECVAEKPKAAVDTVEAEGFTSATAPGAVFATREAMREHMKSDWHKFNLKRKTQGQPMLPHDEFREACFDMEFSA